MRRHTSGFAWLSAIFALAGCNSLPPASLEQAAAWQGTYAGDAVINDAALPGPVCQPQLHIFNFKVVGNQVSFAEFSGTIRNNATVELLGARIWMGGQFVPNAFVGELAVPPQQVCRYRVLLNRVS